MAGKGRRIGEQVGSRRTATKNGSIIREEKRRNPSGRKEGEGKADTRITQEGR